MVFKSKELFAFPLYGEHRSPSVRGCRGVFVGVGLSSLLPFLGRHIQGSPKLV